MRRAALVLLAACAHSAPATPVAARSWPTAGICIPPRDAGNPCIQVSVDDAHAIQQVLAGYGPARALAMKPITDGAIGAFLLYGGQFTGFSGDVLRAEAVEKSGDTSDSGYRIILGRDAAGWRILDANSFVGGDTED